jgi:hypothetical protein
LGIVTDSNGRSSWNGFFSIYGWNNGRFLPDTRFGERPFFVVSQGYLVPGPSHPCVDQATFIINWRYPMPTCYIRSTHDENGRFRPFPTAALTFWCQRGQVIGSLLRSETPLTFAEIYEAYEEAIAEQIVTCPESELLTINFNVILCERDIAWCLIKLLEHGLATAVATSLTPPTALRSFL